MKKAHFIKILRKRMPECHPSKIGDLLNAMFAEIVSALQEEKSVCIRGLGTFYLKKIDRVAYKDPRNGKHLEAKDRCKPMFRPGRNLVWKKND